jgi:hypothetical protein
VRSTAAGLAVDVRQWLTKARNGDGGWGYYAGKGSRLEPTSLALLALAAAGQRSDAGVLNDWPRRDGLLADRQSGEVSLAANAQAALAALHPGIGQRALASTLVQRMLDAQTLTLATSRFNRQDNALRGWSWQPGLFGWVEPTAWCLIASKRLQRATQIDGSHARIAEGERMLLDRACPTGGWNYGNSNMLGRELQPYVPTTALGLLALQDRRDPCVSRGLTFLSGGFRSEPTVLALSLAGICLTIYGSPPADLDVVIADAWRRSELRSVTASAMLLCLVAGSGGVEAFRA